MALFGRVGGGIYTKAADVGSDLAGKIVENLPEDSPLNPGVIADNVGDNVGDIAGMGADLFGSLAEATCAAVVIGATSIEFITSKEAIYFPLIVTAVGIIASLFTTFFATHVQKVSYSRQCRDCGKVPTLAIISFHDHLPSTTGCHSPPGRGHLLLTGWSLTHHMHPLEGIRLRHLWTVDWVLIGVITELYTSNRYSPVQNLAEACYMGAAPNIILGLALGQMSTVIPIVSIAVTILRFLLLRRDIWSGYARLLAYSSRNRRLWTYLR